MDDYSRRILLPTDFSAQSLSALKYAAGLAHENFSEIILVHVIEPLPRGVARWYNPSELLEQHAESARRKLDDLEKQALTLYPHCRSELHFGIASEVIANLATSLDIDMIVTSSRRRTGIFARLLEGLPEKLVRMAPCPVLAAPADAGPLQRIAATRQISSPSSIPSINLASVQSYRSNGG